MNRVAFSSVIAVASGVVGLSGVAAAATQPAPAPLPSRVVPVPTSPVSAPTPDPAPGPPAPAVPASAVAATRHTTTTPATPATTPARIQVQVTAATADLAEGDQTTYTVRVVNLSKRTFPEAVVSHLLPTGFSVSSTTPQSDPTSRLPEWTAPLPAGGSAQFTDTVRAGTLRQIEADRLITVRQPGSVAVPGARTFSTTFCVREHADGPLLGCASAHQELAVKTSESPWHTWIPIVGMATAVGGSVLLWRLRRRPQA